MKVALHAFCFALMTMAVPSIVAAQSNTAFDGTYAGVSNSATADITGCAPFLATPQPLTVRNGVAQFWGASLDLFVGDVSPQGDFKMSDIVAHALIGKIDPTGKAIGSVSFGDAGCVLTAVWQRQ